jgi:hypothetical protein
MKPPGRIRAWLLWVDARWIRKRFCFFCDRQTIRVHVKCCQRNRDEGYRLLGWRP